MKYQNTDTKERRGSYGGMTSTTIKAAGETINILKTKVPKRGPDAKMTYDQREQQAVFATKVAAWQGMKDQTEISYERTKPCQSMLDLFLAHNKDVEVPLLSKQQSDAGYQLLTNYVISYFDKKLPSIGVRQEGDKCITTIHLGDLTIDENTTVGEFSAAVTFYNQAFNYGDAITMLFAAQQMAANGQPAKINMAWDKVELLRHNNTQATKKLSELAPNGFFESVAITSGGHTENFLGMTVKDYQMMAPIHSRKQQDKTTICSDQRFVGNNPYLLTFEDPEDKYDAVLSYGPMQRESYYRPSVALRHSQSVISEQELLNGDITLSPSDGSGEGGDSGDSGNQGGNGGNEGGGDQGGSGEGGGQTPSTVEITVACTPAGGGTPNGSGSYTPGSEAQISITPSLNWNFIQWNDGDTSNPRTIIVPNTPTTYTATMQLNV